MVTSRKAVPRLGRMWRTIIASTYGSRITRHFSVLVLVFSCFLEPVTAYAGFLSLIGGIFDKPEQTTEERPINSQNMPLLVAANNSDPRTGKVADLTVVSGNALLATTGPIGTAADLQSEEYSSDQISVYVVREGDTIEQVAALFNVSPNTIAWANSIEKGRLVVGQTLVILPVSGVKYIVKKGDTLESIAKRLKGDAGEIADFNGLGPDHALSVGDEIMVPDGEKEVVAPVVTTKKPTIASSYYGWPVPGGVRTQALHGHNGVDIGAPLGNRVVAAAAGTVIVSRDDGGWNGGYGNYVVIAHPNGTQTLYAHHTHNLVSVGQHVEKGQQIATVGSTGHSTGPHVHFEVRGARNPFGY